MSGIVGWAKARPCARRASPLPTLPRKRGRVGRGLVGTRSLPSGRPNGSGPWLARWQAPVGPVGYAHPTINR
jgi:hypothetical protein